MASTQRSLVPRTFYFILEHNDVWGETGSGDESYHVELAVYPLTKDGSAIAREDKDHKDGQGKPIRIHPLIFRSWVAGERERFKVVYARRPVGGHVDFTGKLEAFPCDDRGYGIRHSASNPKLPALVLAGVNVEVDREYVAFGRVNDGIQWGSWRRVPQSRLDFVTEFLPDQGLSNVPMRDIQVSDPRPSIVCCASGTHLDTPAARLPWTIPVKGAGALSAQFNGAVSDAVFVAKVLVNGEDMLKSGKASCDPKHRAVLFDNLKVPVTEGCPRIEVVAENVFGQRTTAVQVFLPTYDEKGRVTEYRAEHREFHSERYEGEHKFRIRYYPVPYRSPLMTQGSVAAHLLAGEGTFKQIPLEESQVEPQEPFLGPDLWPDELQPQDDSDSPGEIRVQIRAVATGGPIRPDAPPSKLVPPGMDDAIVYSSDPLMLVESKVLGKVNDVIGVVPGDLLDAHVLSEPTEGLNSELRYAASPVAAAADVCPITEPVPAGSTIPALKNGDVMWLRGFTVLSEPRGRVRPRSAISFSDERVNYDASAYAPWPMKQPDSPVQTFSDYSDTSSPMAYVHNLDDQYKADDITRDEPDIPVKNPVLLRRIDRDPGAIQTDVCGRYCPGRASAAFVAGFPLRLVTQAYKPEWLGGLDVTPITSLFFGAARLHQVLPNGYLCLEIQGTSVARGFRVLEITKRWHIDGSPSVQPAAAGTSRRVAGPGTHRVLGLHDKQEDGSIYVHNGEFFQAAEDLHAGGKHLGLSLRRTHLSHSLFTTPVGRNWDFIGNARLIEMFDGSVHLLDGESGVEVYRAKKGVASPCTPLTLSRAQGFDYGKLYALSGAQYVSPPGAYRSLLKARPVAMDGMPVGDDASERFYLVDKHGEVRTFTEDVRFHTVASCAGSPPDANEPPPGVRRQYLLACVHHRVQQSFMKLQRDEKGLLRGIIDDMGRVTLLDYAASRPEGKSFDMFLESVRDFAGRKVSFARPKGDDRAVRDLAAVTGPERLNSEGTPAPAPTSGYGYKDEPSDGPRHRLKSVVDPREYAGKQRPWLEILDWKKGQVAQQAVSSHLDAASLALVGGEAVFPTDLRGSIKFVHHLTAPRPSGGQFPVTWRVERDGRTLTQHEFLVEKAAGFDRVKQESVNVTGPRDPVGHRGLAVTSWEHNRHGEIIKVTLPSKGTLEFNYAVDGSGAGNLLGRKAGGGAGPVSEESTTYSEPFNLPLHTKVLTCTGFDAAGYAETDLKYTPEGSLKSVQCPASAFGVGGTFSGLAGDRRAQDGTASVAFFLYRADDGLLDQSVDPRGVVTDCFYYGAGPSAAPGDASRQLGMRARVTRKPGKPGQAPSDTKPDNPRCDIGSVDRYYRDLKAGIVSTPGVLQELEWPSLLGDARAVVDASGRVRITEFNSVSQALRESAQPETSDNRAPYWYEAANLITLVSRCLDPRWGKWIALEYDANDDAVLTTVPGTSGLASVQRRTTCRDGLGNVVASGFLDESGRPKLVSVARQSLWGADSSRVDVAGNRTDLTYDERGLCIASATTDAATGDTIAETMDYDANGNLIYTRDACDWAGARYFDAANRLVRSLSATGLLTETGYGPGSVVNRETSRDASDLKALRDALGEDPETKTAGDRLPLDAYRRAVDFRARAVAKGGAAAGDVLSDVQYYHDLRGNVARESRLHQPVGGSGVTENFDTAWSNDDRALFRTAGGRILALFDYDAFGRLVRETPAPLREAGGKSLTTAGVVERAYDGAGRLLTLKSPDADLLYGYDINGRQRGVTNVALCSVESQTWFDIEGRMLYSNLPAPGTEQWRHYDFAGRPVNTETQQYGPAPSGNVGLPAQFEEQVFDDANRLTRTLLYYKTSQSTGSGPVYTTNWIGKIFFSRHTIHGPRQVVRDNTPLLSDASYDRCGNLLQRKDALGTRFVTDYLAGGLAVRVRAFHGDDKDPAHRRLIIPDALGRPVRAWDRLARHFSLDNSGNVTFVPGEGISLAATHVVRRYDTMGFLASETQEIADGTARPTLTVFGAHEPWGARRKITPPSPAPDNGETPVDWSPTTVSYAYDIAGDVAKPSRVLLNGDSAVPIAETTVNLSPWPAPSGQSASRTEDLTFNPLPRSYDNTETMPGFVLHATTPAPAKLGAGSTFDLRRKDVDDAAPFFFTRSRVNGWGRESHMTDRGTDTSTVRGLDATAFGAGAENSDVRQTTLTRHYGLPPDGTGVARWTEGVTSINVPAQKEPMNSRTHTAREQKDGFEVADVTITENSCSGVVPDHPKDWTFTATATNSYKDRKDQYLRNPKTVEADHVIGAGSAVVSEGVPFKKTVKFKYDRSGKALWEPGAEEVVQVRFNVFGRPVQLLPDRWEGKNASRCTMLYDAFDRPVLKDVPADVKVPAQSRRNAITIAVSSAEGTVKGVGGSASWAVEQIKSLAPKVPDATFIVNLSGNGVYLGSNVNEALNEFCEAGDDGKPKYPYRRIIFQGAEPGPNSVLPITARLDIKNVSNLTFRRLRFEAPSTIDNCAGLTFDGCVFQYEYESDDTGPFVTALGRSSGLNTAEGRYNGLQFQNCTFCYRRNCALRLVKPFNSSVFVTFCRFTHEGDVADSHAVIVDGKTEEEKRKNKEEGWFRLGLLNNLFIVPGLTERSSIVMETTLGADPAKESRTCFSDFNVYHSAGRPFRDLDSNTRDAWRKHGEVNSRWFNGANLPSDLIAAQAFAGLPGLFSTHTLVFTDATGRLRDPMHPSVGPEEMELPGTTALRRHRYVYFGAELVRRERERPGSKDAPEITTYVPTNPNGGGSLWYFDSDSRVNAAVQDVLGEPWETVRLREGKIWPSRIADKDTRDTLTDWMGDRNNAPEWMKKSLRNTGVLHPLPVPGYEFFDYLPWHQRVMESEVLMGRWGGAGWDGGVLDAGLVLQEPELQVPGWWSRFWDHLWQWETWKYLLIGAAVMGAGVLLSWATGGASIPLAMAIVGKIVGAGLVGAGIAAGVTGSITHDAQSAWNAGVAGFAAGALTAGMGMATGVMAIPGQTAMASGGLSFGAQAAASVPLGFAGGMAYGTTGGGLSGLSLGDSLQQGVEEGMIGAASGPAFALAGSGIRAGASYGWRYGKYRSFRHRASVGDFRTRKDHAAFWATGPNKGLLQQHMWKDGDLDQVLDRELEPIFRTKTGKYLSSRNLWESLGNKEWFNDVWGIASRKFAQGARGHVKIWAWRPGTEGARDNAGSLFYKVELPELVKLGKAVTQEYML